MTKYEYPELDEVLYRDSLPNGLQTAVVPRRGFEKKIAYLVTGFGSIHTSFTLDGTEYTVPGGVAHYLEHKMFELPGGRDVSGEFAALGANVNAFTSYDMTAYYFSCTQEFDRALRLLLEFVSTPYFTQESVEREQGIIRQEIDMNLDSPDSVIFDRLMEIMYANHPVRVPDFGNGRFHPGDYPGDSGNLPPGVLPPQQDAIVRGGRCGAGTGAGGGAGSAAGYSGTRCRQGCPLGRSAHPVAAETRCSMEVAMPTFSLAFKCPPAGVGDAAIRQEMVADLAAEALFGESSELYLRLYEQGLIDSSFGGGFETLEDCAMLCAGGDSDHPEQVRDEICREAERLAAEGIDERAFLRMKRSALGRRIRGLDSMDGTAFRVCAYHYAGFDYFRFPEIYREITARDIQAFLAQNVKQEYCAISIITPL